MKKLFQSPLARLSFGLTMLTISILLLTDMVGIAPDTRNAELQTRKTIAESLAVQLSGQIGNQSLDNTRALLRTVVERSDNILTAAIRKGTDEPLVTYGNHSHFWTLEAKQDSTAEQIRVPIFDKQGPWGSIELSFEPLSAQSSMKSNNFMTVVWFMIPAGFLAYFLFLKRALRELNPDAVIPERVRTALDTLAEGLLIIDENSFIVFANNAFARKTGLTSKNLLGKACSNLDWVFDEDTSSPAEMPWNSLLDGELLGSGIKTKLKTGQNKTYTFVINASPITATGEKVRGALITFDDITAIELKNDELNQTLEKLQESQKDINRQNQELQILATRDPLTNTLNRRSLFQGFDVLFADAKTQREDLSCIMVDIDLFKQVNDVHGHAVGDQVIIEVAKILSECSRPNDLVGRYGGEEFCVVLPSATLLQCAEIAKRIRLAIVQKHGFKLAPDLRITASLGISTLTGGAISPSQLVDEADRALYQAKETGRNRIIVWPQCCTAEEFISAAADNDYTTSTPVLLTNDTDNNKPQHQLNNDEQNSVAASTEQPQTATKAEDILFRSNYCPDDHSSETPVSNIPTRPRPATKKAEDILIKTSDIDPENAYPQNRMLVLDRIDQAIKRSQRYHTLVAVLILNIDTLQRINDTLGFNAGEEAATIAVSRLKEVLRDTDTIALHKNEQSQISVTRFNNNEIIVLLTDVNDADYVTSIMQRIHATLNEKIEVENDEFFLNTDIGISLSPLDSENANTLIRYASNALHEARNNNERNNFAFYSEEVNQRSIMHIKMEADLHHAIERDEFELYYQPKINLKTGNILGMEALLRWNHPRHGLVMPTDFIPLAENTGLINSISQWVIQTACRQIKLWQEAGYYSISVAVNLSAVEFRNRQLSNEILEVITAASLQTKSLELEITETAVMQNMEAAIDTLEKLSQKGVAISLDDFGAGYSSLSYLQRFPISKVKIDRSFISNFTNNTNDAAIVSAVIAMGHSLGLQVVAEGVETEEQLRLLQGLNCDEIQGYFISRPIPADEASDLLAQSAGIRHLVTEYDVDFAGMIADFDNSEQLIN